jgi:hypothetical protein
MSIAVRVERLERARERDGYGIESAESIILLPGDEDPVLPPRRKLWLVVDFRGRESADIPNSCHLRFRPEAANA